jgi:DNA helicase IV
VDEAQDLSALELRMVARRSRQGSMTVLGDLAQATTPAAQTDWRDARRVLGARLEELVVGYRVPAPIIEFANRLLPEAAPGVRPTSSVRLQGDAPRVVAVTLADRGLRVADETIRLAQSWNTVAVVAPQTLTGEIGQALGTAGVEYIDGQRSSVLGEHVTLLTPAATKGLEFDAVLVVEPGLIMSEEPHGARALYVVLTRAVQHLSLIHADPLPLSLAPAA